MEFRIDASSAVPPFEQLREQIRSAAADGSLPVGAKLPTVRALADQLGIATNTVARSYRELEQDEVIETRGRNGSFIAAFGDASHRQAQLAADTFARRIRQLQVDPDAAIDLAKAALGREV